MAGSTQDAFARAAHRLAHEIMLYVQRCEERAPPPAVTRLVMRRADEAAALLKQADATAAAIAAIEAAADTLAAAHPVSFAQAHLVRRARA